MTLPSTFQTLRQPKRAPGSAGGQFAGVVRTHVAVDLDSSDFDPWADPEPPADAATEAERRIAAVREEALALDAYRLGAVPDDRDERARWNDDRHALIERYEGASTEQIVVGLGSEIADLAHARLEVTPEQAAAAWNAESERIKAESDEIETKIGAAYNDSRAEQDRVRKAAMDAYRAGGPYADEDAARDQARQTAEREAEAVRARVREEMEPLQSRRIELVVERLAADQTFAQHHRAAADAYLEVLSQVRPLGGDLPLHASTDSKSRAAFTEAAQIFPTQWLEESAATRAPRGRISKRRAHYAHASYQAKKKRATVTYGDTLTREEMESHRDRDSVHSLFLPVRMVEGGSDPDYDFEILDAGAPQAPDQHYVRASVDVRRDYYDSGIAPRGRGWTRWTHPDRPEDVYWRRPRTRLETVTAEVMPELTTNARPVESQGRSATFSVAAHELSHRFEHTVTGVTALETAFRERRTTDEHCNPRPLKSIYPGRRGSEVAREGGFPLLYTGKEYAHGSTEVLSTGIQALIGGEHGGLAGAKGYKADPEFAHFVLGAMATVGLSREGKR